MPAFTAITKWLQAIVDLVLGYDYFISYSHQDGILYPKRLTEQLTALHFKVFLDTQVYVAGTDMQAAMRRRVRMSTYLVVIGGRCAYTQSEWVEKEVRASLEARRTPILIDINNAFRNLEQNNALQGLLRDRIYISQTLSGPEAGPSDEALEQLQKSFQATRQETLRLRVATLLTVLFGVIAMVALWQYREANLAKAVAEHRLAGQLAARANELAVDPGKLKDAIDMAGESLAVEPTLEVLPALRSFLALVPPSSVHQLSDKEIDVLSFNSTATQLIAGDTAGAVKLVDASGTERLVTKHNNPVIAASFSSDDRWIVSLASGDDTPHICDISGNECHTAQACSGAAEALQVAPRSRGNLVAFGAQGMVCLLNPESGNIQNRLQVSGPVKHLAFNADGSRLAAITPDHVTVWTVPKWQAVRSVPVPPWDHASLDPTLSTALVAMNGDGWVIKIATGHVSHFIHPDFIKSVAISPDRKYFATASANVHSDQHEARLFELEKAGFVDHFPQSGQVGWVAFVAGSKILTASGPEYPSDDSSRLRQLGSDQLVAYLAHEAPITALAVEPSGSRLATASQDGVVKLWDLTKTNTKTFDFNARVLRVQFAASSDWAAVTSRSDSGREVVDMMSPAGRLVRLTSVGSFIHDAAVSGHGERVAVATDNGILLSTDLAKEEFQTIPSEKKLQSVLFSADDSTVVASGDQTTILDLKSGRTRQFDIRGEVLALSADASKLAIGYNPLKLLDTITGKVIALPEGSGDASSAAFSANGEYLVAGFRATSNDARACIWQTESARSLGCVSVGSGVVSVAITPGSDVFVTGDELGFVQFWDRPSRREIVRMRYPVGVRALSFGRTGSVLRIATYGSASRYLSVESELWDPVELFRRVCGRIEPKPHTCARFAEVTLP